MKFSEIPTVKPQEAVKMAEGLNPVFVSAKGLNGIRLPLQAVRNQVLELCPPKPVFVPVTDKWNSPDDVLAKDFALQLREDSGTKAPIMLSATVDRYERLADLDIAEGFRDNAVVIMHPAPTDAELDKMRQWHLRAREIIGEDKPLRLFADHILTVQAMTPKSKKATPVFVDAGGGFMIFDQIRKYLQEKRITRVIAVNVTLAGKESTFLPYIYDNFEDLGNYAENENKTIRVLDAKDAAKGPPVKPAPEKPKPKPKTSKAPTKPKTRKV